MDVGCGGYGTAGLRSGLRLRGDTRTTPPAAHGLRFGIAGSPGSVAAGRYGRGRVGSAAGQRQERRQHIPVRGAAPARGETFQDGRGTWTAGAALRVIVVLLTCSPSGERRVLSSAGAAVAWSSPGAPTRAGGCRPTSRGFASELMTCPALLHLSDRISAVLLDVREHTNGTDRSQRSMARSHIPEPQGRWERPCGTGVLLRVDVVYSQQHTPRGTCSPGRPHGASVQPTSSSTCASTPPAPVSSRRPVSATGSASTNGRS